MAATAQASKTDITLKGSVQIVTEFFGFSINSILYQRGIYPPETFTRVQKYGLQMLVTSDEGLSKYLGEVLAQLSNWLLNKMVQRLVLVITSTVTGEVLERWQFDVDADVGAAGAAGGAAAPDAPAAPKKTEKEIMTEIQALIRQITASVSFLPLLNDPCTFDLLVYADSDVAVPQAWEESDPRYIANSSEVRLRSFTTTVHKVDAMVSYKCDDDDDDA